MPDPLSDQVLLSTPLADLMERARGQRDRQFGRRVTYSPKVFIPLTRLCRDACQYCTFAQPPSRVASPYLPMEEVLAIATAGAQAGCHEALFTLG
ncbi:MAG: fbiC, partial [Acidimicrobiia bacterium]|nr:fbiC [Acidimicrobiia bacterium]